MSDTKPTTIAAAIIGFQGALFAALDPSGALGARWSTVVQTGVALVVLVIAGRHVTAKADAQAQVEAATAASRNQTIAEVSEMTPPATTIVQNIIAKDPAKIAPAVKAAAKKAAARKRA